MYRVLYFLAIILVPLTFSWWLFVPMSLLAIFLARLPFEIILAGFILDLIYYFGDSFFARHLFFLIAFLLIIISYVLGKRIYWRKFI